MREYRERVYKKSFIITTILMPLIIILLAAAPSLIMEFADSDTYRVTVVDDSGMVASKLKSDEVVAFDISEAPLDRALVEMESDEGCFGVLHIGKDVIEKPNQVRLYTSSASSMVLEENIASQIEKVIENERLKEHNIENLDEILAKVKATVHLTTINKDAAVSSTMAASVIGMVLGFLLYFILSIYGGMVMNSVIEEKNSRILDVMVSTVKPFEMLMGKILGIAMVAATQIVVWGVLLLIFSAAIMPALLPGNLIDCVHQVQAGADISALSAEQNISPSLVMALAAVLDTGHIAMIMVSMLLFTIGGFLLYASLYAAVGASVDQAQDAQQFTILITLPIILSFIIMMLVVKDPNSPIVLWSSLIPLTAPVVMVARIPSGVPLWEIATSLTLLYTTFVVFVWGAAKIYKVGIFMHGSKPKLRDFWHWLRY
jgi:ABC-2 type transport system permease protein